MKINEIFYSIQGEGLFIGMPTTFIRTTGCNLRCVWCDTKYAYHSGKEMSVQEILRKAEKFPTEFVCITGGEPLIQPEISSLIEALLKNRYFVNIETNGSISIYSMLKKLQSIPRCYSTMSLPVLTRPIDRTSLAMRKISISMDIKCPSSKMHHKMLFSNIKFLREVSVGGKVSATLKFGIKNEMDYKYAKNIIFKYNPKAEIVFQPVSDITNCSLVYRKVFKWTKQHIQMKKLNWLTEKVLQDDFGKFHIRVLPQLHKLICRA